MAFALTWMPAVLEAAGLKVAEVEGWAHRGRAEMGQVLGVMIHHTVGPRTGNMPSLKTLVNGRSDLPGPLCNLGLGRDGTWYIVAAGRANHAGVGVWKGVSTGNSSFIGIECENTGRADDLPWPAVQMDALRRGCAELLRHSGRDVPWCIGHKEFALPAGRKPDPLFDMVGFRREVSDILAGIAPLPQPIPAVEPAAPAGGGAPRATVRRGSAGPLVKQLQQALGLVPADGLFGAATEAAVREWQRGQGLVPDGIVGPKSWARLDGP
jgi:N-acetylmuramoyl-L-alanine amidase/Putative peptidoglycan binding domain